MTKVDGKRKVFVDKILSRVTRGGHVMGGLRDEEVAGISELLSEAEPGVWSYGHALREEGFEVRGDYLYLPNGGRRRVNPVLSPFY